MLGFPPRSMLLQDLMLSQAPVLCHGLMGTQWCGRGQHGEAGEGFSEVGLGFSVPGRSSWGLGHVGYCLVLLSCGRR